MPSDSEQVLRDQQGPVCILTMNRPERRNALVAGLLDDLRRELEVADADPDTRVVVLTGAGGYFSSGADLRGEALGAERVLRDHYEPLITTMVGLSVPIVAALDGFAAGAGASIALACDFRVMARDAYVYLPFAGIGLVPDAGLTWLLPRIVGAGRAAQICMLDEKVDAASAHSWGLASAVADGAASLERALGLAQGLASRSSSLGAIKAALVQSWTHGLVEHMVLERDAQRRLQGLPDYPEAVSAFRERRPPSFAPRQVPSPTGRGGLG